VKALVLIVTFALGILAVPVLTAAQTRGKLPVVGVLNPGTAEILSDPKGVQYAFLQGLRELGYIEGQTIHLEYRFAEWQWDRLPALAAELVQLKPEVIVTGTGQAVLAARQATTTIPIVQAVGGDLEELGLVASLARPGGNITGQILRDRELAGKRLELLKEAAPTIAHVAVLIYARGIASQPYPSAFEAEAQALGVRLQRVDAGTPEAIDAALATIATSGAEALMIQDNPMFTAHRQRILDFARAQRLPTACGVRAYAEAGCLIAYAPDILAMYRRAAVFVDKILKGTTPADLPIELPHKLNLFLNVKTAETLGITLPPSLLRLADEVIK
jgi:putative ABC transport system substrate-binding protein